MQNTILEELLIDSLDSFPPRTNPHIGGLWMDQIALGLERLCVSACGDGG